MQSYVRDTCRLIDTRLDAREIPPLRERLPSGLRVGSPTKRKLVIYPDVVTSRPRQGSLRLHRTSYLPNVIDHRVCIDWREDPMTAT